MLYIESMHKKLQFIILSQCLHVQNFLQNAPEIAQVICQLSGVWNDIITGEGAATLQNNTTPLYLHNYICHTFIHFFFVL